jgi:hypothetical protein
MKKQELIDIIKEEIKVFLLERCQKGYKTHPSRKTKKMYGKTYRNCVKTDETNEEQDPGEILGEEGLRAWFDDKDGDGQTGWVQVGGKYDGKPCAKQKGQKTKPKCTSPEKRKTMSKKEKESAARRKRAKDPNPNRKGKPINVKTNSSHKKAKGKKS